MAWRIELSDLARRNLRDIDRETATRLLRFLNDRIATLENPRDLGGPLKGSRLGMLWKYRVGDYRVIADLQEDWLRILVVRLSHRREVYRQ